MLCSIFIIVPARMQLAVTHVNAVAGGGSGFHSFIGRAVRGLIVGDGDGRDKINCGWQQLVISGV